MNEFIIADIAKYILLLSNFKKELEISALKKDGIIDREEQKIIDEVTAETDRYIKSNHISNTKMVEAVWTI